MYKSLKHLLITLMPYSLKTYVSYSSKIYKVNVPFKTVNSLFFFKSLIRPENMVVDRSLFTQEGTATRV